MKYRSILPLVFCFLSVPAISQISHLAEGDRAWADRGNEARGARAAAAPIQSAIDAYATALDLQPRQPRSLEIRWKLLRALYYQGEYTHLGRDDRLAIFNCGRKLAEESLDLLWTQEGGSKRPQRFVLKDDTQKLADNTIAAPLYFWSAVHWGLWGRYVGKITAARQGVAGRIRDYVQLVIALDEGYEYGGGHRLLGRLHTEAPRIPFFTGWISRDQAVHHLQRAIEIAPRDFYNRLYLADALWMFRSEQKAEAKEMLQALTSETLSGEYAVEETHIINQARALLKDWD